jgi:hypothetical protein
MHTDARLLRLLGLGLIRLAVEPDSYKDQPASGCDANTSDPGVGAADDETAWPLIVSKVADSDGALLVDVAEERTLVVDDEVENTMLIGHGEAGLEDGAVGSRPDRVQSHTVEGRQHAEFELERVSGSMEERDPTVTTVLGQFDREVLHGC